ncbi:type II toxin-antitoxin system HicA family toxin [Ulvibacter antarcticus]|uniref:Putative RNA binding protein YcfA (HicA-like mRNA interferase family) n=1 Tax=Ulvibacter antarcticus TaxID=442714 RepID=A0A3L9YB41_9FLAO|nr:type II toxin-antitoxin system HicA family toxin [Ulvibacter antarcticus]RMA56289.1 putative RNA binding protein YcfA (HicA-like mRNA interferase family) [Ulvibacter antarcticus]
MDSKSLINMLKSDGWELNRIKGSHHIFSHQKKIGIVVVPHPRKDIPKGTTNSILKQAGLK